MKKMFACVVMLCCGILFGEEAAKPYEKNYTAPTREQYDPDPFVQLKKVLMAAKERGMVYPNAGILSTDAGGKPYSRNIFISKILPEGFVFFTNPNTGKWAQMKENQNATFVLYTRDTEPRFSVIANGVVNLNYKDPLDKDHCVTINGKEYSFAWKSFLFVPHEIQFASDAPQTAEFPYIVSHSYVYKKGAEGKWQLSDDVKYYPIPAETDLFNNR